MYIFFQVVVTLTPSLERDESLLVWKLTQIPIQLCFDALAEGTFDMIVGSDVTYRPECLSSSKKTLEKPALWFRNSIDTV